MTECLSLGQVADLFWILLYKPLYGIYATDQFLCVTLFSWLLLNFSETLAILHVVLAWFLMRMSSVCS